MASVFSYIGLNAQGKEISGQLHAENLAEARALLRGQGIHLLELQQGELDSHSLGDTWHAFWKWFRSGLSVRNSDLMLFYRQMQLMLGAGHTILEALEAAGKLASRPRLTMQLDRCAERIRGGSSFSAAISQERSTFPRIAVKLAEAGEASGELDSVFDRLAALSERRADIRRQLLTALTYPTIVLLIAIGVIAFLVTTVVPRFAVFLQSRGKSIPWAAKMLLDTADWLEQWGIFLALGVLGVIVALLIVRRIPPVRLVMDRLILKVPVLGSTLMAATMAQVTWTFGLLLKSRLTVMEALRTVTQIVGNASLNTALESASKSVLEGSSIAVAFDRPPIPHLVRHMSAVGERSGEMEGVMEALGKHYQKELDSRVKFLSSMIEPVLTLLIGGVVGFVYYAFFQAVMSVSTGGG